jgi:CDP-diacylglycerol--glycerol-3-phosphate 3-phosphatidyltransferase
MHLKRNLPNALSILRIVLIVPLLNFYYTRAYLELTFIIVIIILSDFLDGYLARKVCGVSEAGKVLDPLADKICTATICIALIIDGTLPIWLFIIILARELLILTIGLILITLKKTVPVSNLVGKYAMGIIAASLAVYIYDLKILLFMADILIVIAVLFSLLNYGWVYLLRPGK